MPFYLWSESANSNATADPTINYSEGMAPSQLNDSARAAMARLREWGNDIAGAIVTSGTSTAYTVASNQVFDTLAHLDGQIIAFSPHTTNDATVTLSVDVLTAKPLRSAPNVELQAGTIIQGTPYIAIYSNTDGAFYLQGFFGNPYNIPLAAGLDYWAPTAPNSSFAFPIGQPISRTTFASLFALIGTTYGVGDGSTTFNLPDKTGRASVMKEATANRLTSTFFGGNSTALGAVGGAESQTLTAAQIPTITSSGTSSVNAGGAEIPITPGSIGNFFTGGQPGGVNALPASTSGWSGVGSLSGTNSVTSNNTGGAAHRTVQPTIVCNYIMRII